MSNQYGLPDDAWKAYRKHRNKARSRGIPFLFGPIEWWTWWQVNNRWSRRGRTADDFVMARRRDSGAYEPGNVYCTTQSSNSREASPVPRILSVRQRRALGDLFPYRVQRRADNDYPASSR